MAASIGVDKSVVASPALSVSLKRSSSRSVVETPGAPDDVEAGDEFRAVLHRKLAACGEELWTHHQEVLQQLRRGSEMLQSRLSEVLQHLEAQDHPSAWAVPKEPLVPQVQGAPASPLAPAGGGARPRSSRPRRRTTSSSVHFHATLEESPPEEAATSEVPSSGSDAEPEDWMIRPLESMEPEEDVRFVAREVWTKCVYVSQGSIQAFRRADTRHHHRDGTIAHLGESYVALQAFMVHPQARARMVWSLVGLALLCYDVVSVPVEVCFHVAGNSPVFMFFEWMSLSYWTIDIALNFLTGIHQHGLIEMRPSAVAKSYVKHWFLFDVFLVFWECAVLLNDMGALELVSILRLARVLRLLRIVRMAAISHVINDMFLFVNDSIFVMLGPLRIGILLIFCTHVLGCTWYAVGQEENGWAADAEVQHLDLFHKYIISVWWAVTQFTSAAAVVPITFSEHVCSLVTGILAFIISAVFIGEMVHTTSLFGSHSPAHMQRLCRQFLQRHNISKQLSRKLMRWFLEGNEGGFTRLKNVRERLEHEAQLLEALPVVMQMDLYEELRKPLLEKARLFSDLHIVPHNNRAMRELCVDVITCVVKVPGTFVFTMGDACSRTLIVESGTAVYDKGTFTSSSGESTTQSTCFQVARMGSDSVQLTREPSQALEEEVRQGRMISEAVLWTKWVHCGDLTAESHCTMLATEATSFADLVCNHANLRLQARVYVRRFIEFLNSRQDVDAFTDLLDVPEGLVGEHEYGLAARYSKDHFIFISHFKKEAGTEATLLEEAFQRMFQASPEHVANEFRRPVFLDSSDLKDLSTLERHVRRTHNLVVLLTPKLFTRPWCLIEMVIAIRSGVEIVPVEIVRPGLSFKYPDDSFYEKLSRGETMMQDDIQLLRSKGIELHDLNCIKKVFDKIAVSFSPHKSLSIREAELRGILENCSFREDRARTTPDIGHDFSVTSSKATCQMPTR